ncbi:S1C family serine protease [Alteribacillus bidgolensis]|uniref:Trypsin-like peptidase domain-containing protein n=1 Tax=Alteribacillus bidgolensis TaxID=930129 RepID=A0A1G8CHZ6_9BACI|nr:S1C family serine protease [Alteribacillus bidgolensis]SDH44540.1 Trypsin-like peptidase domain-containing protein [Alteribacillus bidgolensis]
MDDKHKDKLDELYDEKYEEISYEEFKEALDEEAQRKPSDNMEKKKNRRGVRVIAVLLTLMLVFQVLAMLFDMFRIDAIEFLKTSYRLSQDEDIQEWKEAVVTIQGEGRFGRSKGTGFFIEKEGLVLTNHHVIEQQDTIGINTEDGEIYEGELLASDAEKDLALIEIEGEEGFETLHLQNKISEENEHIYVIGNPLSFTKIANEGKILGEETTRENALGISAPIYRGNSGSPVISENGDVTGVVYAKKSINHPEQESIGLAVPIDDVHSFLEETKE